MKLLFIILTFSLLSTGVAQTQELKDLPIEIQVTTKNKTYVQIESGESETKSRITYQYRYEGDEKWMETGRNFLNIQTILERFESSKLLFESSLKKRRLVIPFYLVGAAGLTVAVFSGLRPKFDEFGSPQGRRWGTIIGAGAVGLAGSLTAGYLRDSGIKLALEAVEAYNKEIKSSTEQ